MLLHRPGAHHTADDPRRPLGPEAVYLRRMLAWSAVVAVAFIGIELIINDYRLIGLPLAVIAAAGVVTLRSQSLAHLLRSTPPKPKDNNDRPSSN